ncbi:uncharacterized protein JCM6883_002261 [Sporobolomyces salmoneus]|uniref:uncharacterized protein n=1 Tax=Sporobolomyces salmoneus TaxID=183962 RepID=UPI00316C38E8
MQPQSQFVDTPLTTSSTSYHSNSHSVATPLSTSVPFMPSIPHQLPSFSSTSTAREPPRQRQSSATDNVVFGQDFAMHGIVSSAASTTALVAPTNQFTDGAGEDVTGGSTDAVKNAFRSLDWVDLSLTPAIGSGSDGSSADGGNGDRYRVRKNRPS